MVPTYNVFVTGKNSGVTDLDTFIPFPSGSRLFMPIRIRISLKKIQSMPNFVNTGFDAYGLHQILQI